MRICRERAWLHQPAAIRRDGNSPCHGMSSGVCHQRQRHLQEWVTPSLKRWDESPLWSSSLFPLAARETRTMFLTVCSAFIPLKSESGGTTQGKWLIAPSGAKVTMQISRGLHHVIGQGSSTYLYLEWRSPTAQTGFTSVVILFVWILCSSKLLEEAFRRRWKQTVFHLEFL